MDMYAFHGGGCRLLMLITSGLVGLPLLLHGKFTHDHKMSPDALVR